MDSVFSKYQCGFRKGFSSQNCLAAVLEKRKSAIENKKLFGELLTDLSKAFEFLPHDLLTTKLKAYGFSRKSLLGTLLFNIILCGLFFVMNDVEFPSYADDDTSYAVRKNIDDVTVALEDIYKQHFKWFSDNQVKANPDKCHLICSTDNQIGLTIESEVIKNIKCRKLLGIKFDNRLTFKNHIDDICKKSGQKLNALSRITTQMGFTKKRTLVNAFFLSQFNYCNLVWVCYNRTLNDKINRLHERCLRLIFNDKI